MHVPSLLLGDQEHPPGPPDESSESKARTGNDPGRGGWVIEMDTPDYWQRRSEQLEARVKALEYELGLGRNELPRGAMPRGGWINTYTGRKVFPLDLRPEDIDIRDIAHALALECRYANHTSLHYSVAQHSVILSKIVDPKYAMDALLHDAEEAYLGDLPRPLKVLPEFEFWRNAGARAAEVIQRVFGLGPEPGEVKWADHAVCGVEAERLMNTHPDWVFQPSPKHWKIDKVWSWQEAEAEFLKRFWELETARSADIEVR